MLDPAELALRERELKLQEQQLILEHKRLYVEFAKYGFAGTLKAAVIGLLVVVGLAVLNAFTEAKFETWGLVAIAVVVLMGSVAFGYFSLGKLPKIAAKISQTGTDFSFDTAEKPEQ